MPANDFVEGLVVFGAIDSFLPVFLFGFANSSKELSGFTRGFPGINAALYQKMLLVYLLVLWSLPGCRVLLALIWLASSLN